MPKLTECHHPLVTGEQAYGVGVGAATAWPPVRALARWEYGPPGRHPPTLVRHSFEGRRRSIYGALNCT